MPTGYTEAIEDRDISFKEFAVLCARAFGVLVNMRDEPLSKEIPDEIKPSLYYQEARQKAEEDLYQMERMPVEMAETRATEEYNQEMKRVEQSLKKRTDLLIRYKKMLAEVEAWNPPTPDHVGLKEFMIQQITISLPADEKYYHFPVKSGGAEWREE
jgi:hypothetical protein